MNVMRRGEKNCGKETKDLVEQQMENKWLVRRSFDSSFDRLMSFNISLLWFGLTEVNLEKNKLVDKGATNTPGPYHILPTCIAKINTGR